MSEKYYRSKLDCMFSFIVMRYFSVTIVVMNIINLNNKSTRLIHLDALMIVVLYQVKGYHRFPTLPSVHPWIVIIMVRNALFHDQNYCSEKHIPELDLYEYDTGSIQQAWRRSQGMIPGTNSTH